jgi:hypothetical protein
VNSRLKDESAVIKASVQPRAGSFEQKEQHMSGFDTSQPITDKTALQDIDADEKADRTDVSVRNDCAKEADPDELGDATPGPR